MPESLSTLLTVVIPVKNEERNLPACLASLEGLENRVLVDSGSTDRTLEIAENGGCEIVSFRWDGHFPKKRNWILRNYSFKTPWVLFLDADERLTPWALRELAEILPETKCNGFWVYYDNWFMGRMLRHGDAMRKTALLRVGCGEYERIPENQWSSLDMEIHEHLIIEGDVGKLSHRLEHHDMRSLDNYYAKHNEYSSWEAGRIGTLGDRTLLTSRQKIKYALIRSPFFPVAYFFVSYVFLLGFLDGRAGFYFAIGKCFYFYQIQAKLLMKAVG